MISKGVSVFVMRLGIIGLPQAGKTTIFNLLTHGDRLTTTNKGHYEVRTAVVNVPDSRVERLAALYQPQKTTYAKVTYADVTGLDGKVNRLHAGGNGHSGNGNGNGKKGLSGALMNQLSQMDGFIHVVRCFDNVSVPHSAGSIDPRRDILNLDGELVLNDLIVVEGKLERLSEEVSRRGGREKAEIEGQIDLFNKLRNALSEEKPLRDLDISVKEQESLAGFNFLTLKPVLMLLNLSDGQEAPEVEYPHARSALEALQGKLEMELAQLPEEEARQFMSEFGIQELVLPRVIRRSYELLGLLSFFTVGEDEVRAWTVRRGTKAMEAAGAIHSDLQKGFIRAEVVDYRELLALGGLSEARAKGRLRLESKDYPVQDGEIMHVRYNV
jgi:GTP-binding protein YchF